MERRTFIKNSALLAGVISASMSGLKLPVYLLQGGIYRSLRPPIEKRTFTSDGVEETIIEIKKS
ncbi:MAG: hypothetical protein GYA41_06485, partial [Bacteroidales bacterium]|nr:hypothetical protein [Bacteroidales bacterium]